MRRFRLASILVLLAALERIEGGDLRATIVRIIELAKAHPNDPFYAIWDATRSATPATMTLAPHP